MKSLDINEGRINTDLTPASLPELKRQLIPSGFDPISIDKLDKPVTSHGIIESVERHGMSYSEQAVVIYRANKQGVPRRIDNQDMIAGYPQYGTGDAGVTNLARTRSDLSNFRSTFFDHIGNNQVLVASEDEDFKKISILRPRFYGRHLQPPMSPDFKHVVLPEDFKVVATYVVSHYAKMNTYMKKGRAAIAEGTDAKDTSLGSPTFYAGDAYHAARVATCAAMPVPDYSKDPALYIDALENLGSQLLPDPSIVYASYLSFRQGATNKAIPVWKHTGLGFQADYESKSLYTRQRAVWAAPFYLNVLLTPLVLRMKSSRQNILGMWHDPAKQAQYIPRLQKQGKTAIEIDYSGYDTTISNDLMVFFYEKLAYVGYSPWESTLMAKLTPLQGALTPSFTGATDTASYFRHQVTLMSGLLTTSELGSIISISIVLYCLQKQDKSILDRWLQGNFIILVQSDDVLFTTDIKFDADAFAADAAKLGIVAKVKEGSTFLKRILPVGKFNKMAKPFSRNVQQTFGNEDDYSGKPDAILRLAFASRSEGIQGHPAFKQMFNPLLDIYESSFEYMRSPSLDNWRKGLFTVSSDDVRAIEQYAQSAAGADLLTNLLERAAYDPSAANLINYLKSQGLDLKFLQADQVQARLKYTEALFKDPTPEDTASLLQFCRWNT